MTKDTSKTNILVFLRPFTIENPTLEQQNSFMFCEIINEMECGIKGKFYTNDVLYGKDLEAFIREEVAKFNRNGLLQKTNLPQRLSSSNAGRRY